MTMASLRMVELGQRSQEVLSPASRASGIRGMATGALPAAAAHMLSATAIAKARSAVNSCSSAVGLTNCPSWAWYDSHSAWS